MSGENGETAAGIELTNLSIDVSKASGPSRQVSRAGKRSSSLEIHAFLPDSTFLTLIVDQDAQATEIMDTIIATLGLNSAEARRVLSLWLVSSDLELQLKPNHCPTQLFGKWPVYLRKYTNLSDKAAATQKPLLHLRRNVYISREEDLKVTDAEILELLFTEARCNVMDGTYPCDRELVINLAGILCTMQYGPYNENEHTAEFYKANQAAIFPLAMINDSKALIHGLSQSLSYGKTPSLTTSQDLRVTYLSACSDSLPYYGSVFFDGFIERVNKSFLHSSWLPVRIGANTDGIYVISAEKEEPLLGILYEELTWEYVEVCTCATEGCPHTPHASAAMGRHRVSRKLKGSKSDKVACMPSLLLQYPALPDEQSEGVKFSVLRVYTKSARLIDAFIDNCSDIMKQKALSSPINTPEVFLSHSAGASSSDVIDAPRFPTSAEQSHVDAPRTRESLERSIKGLVKPRKLICQSFTKDGKCVSA